VEKSRHVQVLISLPDYRPEVKVTNTSSENVAKFEYFGTVLKNNLMLKDIKNRLNTGNFCYYDAQDLFPSHPFSNSVIITVYKTIIFPVALDWCETLSLTLRKEYNLTVYENSA
jgi:hypothetical protein